MKNLYYFLFTLAIFTNIKMKIIEIDFENQHQMAFNIFDFELPHGKENLQNKINQWNSSEQKAFLNEQLSLDYIFMSTLFPAILCLGFYVNDKIKDILTNKTIKSAIKTIALLQLLAWLFDYCENIRLEKWIKSSQVGNDFLFEPMVYTKFGIAIVGIVLPILLLLKINSKNKY